MPQPPPIIDRDRETTASVYSSLVGIRLLRRDPDLTADVPILVTRIDGKTRRALDDGRWMLSVRGPRPTRLEVTLRRKDQLGSDANDDPREPDESEGGDPTEARTRPQEREHRVSRRDPPGSREEDDFVDETAERWIKAARAVRDKQAERAAARNGRLDLLRESKRRAGQPPRSMWASERVLLEAIVGAHDPSHGLRALAGKEAQWQLASWLRTRRVRLWVDRQSLMAGYDDGEGRAWTENPALAQDSAEDLPLLDALEQIERLVELIERPAQRCVIRVRMDHPKLDWKEVASEVTARGFAMTADNAKQILNRLARKPGFEALQELQDHRKRPRKQHPVEDPSRPTEDERQAAAAALAEARSAYTRLDERSRLTIDSFRDRTSYEDMSPTIQRKTGINTSPADAEELVRGFLSGLSPQARKIAVREPLR